MFEVLYLSICLGDADVPAPRFYPCVPVFCTANRAMTHYSAFSSPLTLPSSCLRSASSIFLYGQPGGDGKISH